jgi:hypothetical protein
MPLMRTAVWREPRLRAEISYAEIVGHDCGRLRGVLSLLDDAANAQRTPGWITTIARARLGAVTVHVARFAPGSNSQTGGVHRRGPISFPAAPWRASPASCAA